MIKADIEWKLRCPHCGSIEFGRRQGFHLVWRYKCHECERNFFKPLLRLMPSKEYIRIRNRTTELESSMNRLLKRHGWAPSIQSLYSHIPDYIIYQNDWEEDYCKNYLKKRVRKGYRRYDKERL